MSGTLFHAGVIYVSFLVARQVIRTLDASLGARIGGVVRAGALWSGAVILLAGLCSLLGPRSGFTVIRFVSQALFAEGLLMMLALCAADRWNAFARVAYALVALALVAAYVEGYHRGPTNLQVRRHSVDLARGKGVGSLRLLHMSDLQADRFSPYELKVFEEARRLQPDLVVWTGDFVQPRFRRYRHGARDRSPGALPMSP